MNSEAERMLEVFTEWLNKHHEANDEDYRVTRASYSDMLAPGDDPRILADVNILEGYIGQSRIITLYASPYHDEGGPNILTGFFSYDEGKRYEAETNTMIQGEDPKWILEALVQYFDTDYCMIFDHGDYNLHSLPEEAK